MQRGLSLIIVLALCIQPVFAKEITPEDVALSTEVVPVDAPLEATLLPTTPADQNTLQDTETVAIPEDLRVTEKPSIEDLVDTNVSAKETTEKDDVQLIHVTDEIIVKYKETKIDLDTTSGRRSAARLAETQSLEPIDTLREENVMLLKIEGDRTVSETIHALERNSHVAYAQPNYTYIPSTLGTNDMHQDFLWGLERIQTPTAWSLYDLATTTAVIVAVIDTGVAYNHPDILPNMWDGTFCVDENGGALGECNHGYDYEDEDTTPLPTYSSHGTHIAGTIAAVKNNTLGIVGVAPEAKIMALKSGLTTFDNVRSINFAKQNGASVINASWVGTQFDPALYDAIASFPGLFIAAAGNEGKDNELVHSYPSDYDLSNIISVAATDEGDELAWFSNHGTSSVDVGAPGTNIPSTISDTLVFHESFENLPPTNIPDDWTRGGDDNVWSTYATGLPEWGTILVTDTRYPYAENSSTTVTSPTIDLSTGNAVMDFWTACDTEYSPGHWTDYMELAYSANGTDFDTFTRWDEADLDMVNGDTEDGVFPIDGELFHLQNVPIPSQFLTADFKFQFKWVTDESDSEYFGCAVDNVAITTYSDGSDELYGYSNGTSMAVPHVTGLVALLEGYAPHLSPVQITNAVLTTGDTLPALLNMTVTGKRINAGNALQTVGAYKTMTTFAVPGQTGETTIDEIAGTITLTVPFGTDVTTLTPSLSSTGLHVSPPSSASQNFATPVVYTVTAIDGTTKEYTVTVLVAPEVIVPPVPAPPSSGGGGGGGGGGGSSKKSTETYSVTINKDARETTSREVTLTLTREKNATQMQISNTERFVSVPWVPYKSTYAWTLTPNSGAKTVYVRFGKNEKVTGSAQDRIRLQEIPVAVQPLPRVSQTPTVSGTTKAPTIPAKFVTTLSIGSRNQEVTELQKILIAEGFLTITPPTGYFGSITQTAVATYQRVHGLQSTGVVDEATRTKLNGSAPGGASAEQKALLIKALQAKLSELIAELNALKAR